MRMMLAQGFGCFADLALAAEEHKDVPALVAPQLVHGGENRVLLQRVGLVVFFFALDFPVTHLDRVAAQSVE